MDTSAIERRTVKKVTRRLIPFLFLCFAISILDRVNIGFAALQMNSDWAFPALFLALEQESFSWDIFY